MGKSRRRTGCVKAEAETPEERKQRWMEELEKQKVTEASGQVTGDNGQVTETSGQQLVMMPNLTML